MSKSVTEQIIARVSPSSIVSKYLSLKPKGNGEYLGLCPFHNEKTPSFTVSDIKGFYYCFGCKKHGNIFDFIINKEGVDFATALKKLAQIAGIELPKYNAAGKKEKTDVYYKIYEATANFYHQQLSMPIANNARKYLKERGITDEDISKFYLGYSPSNSSFLEKHLAKNFSNKDVIASKVLKMGKHNKVYDPFYNRVVFPIYDNLNRCVAFGGRILGDGQPKYLNSSENPIFIKGEHLYGINFSLRQAYAEKEIIIAEGYLDVISLIKNNFMTVAPLGTALKVSQIEKLWKSVDKIILCLDNDTAGLSAILKVSEEVLPILNEGKSLFIATMTGGKDPDEIIKNLGVSHFRKIIKNALPLSEFLYSVAISKMSSNIAEEKAKLRGRLDEITEKIKNLNVKRCFREFFNDKYWKDFGYKKANSNDNISLNKNLFLQKSKNNFTKEDNIVLNILLNVLYNQKILKSESVIERICELEFINPELDNLRDYVLALNCEGELGSNEDILTSILNILKSYEESYIVSVVNAIKSCSFEDAKQKVKKLFLNYTLGILQRQIKYAEADLLKTPDESVYKRLISLKEEEENILNKINNI